MAATEFPLDEAQLIALFMGSVAYGVHLVSFTACMRILWLDGRERGSVNKLMLAGAIALVTFATLSVAFQLRHVLDAFIWYQGPGGALEELEIISYWVNVMQTVCFHIQAATGDLILIYRCYIVYNRRWIVIALPLLVWMATIVTGGIGIRVTTALKVNTTIDEKQLVPWITSVLILTIVQNLATTSLIAHRICSINRRVSQIRSKYRRPVIGMILESGAIYALSLLIFLIVYLCKNNAQYPVSVCIEQITGIVFDVLIIRVHRVRAAGRGVTSATHGTNLNLGAHVPSGQPLGDLGKSRPLPATAEHYHTQPVQVNVTRQVVTDVDNNFVFGENIDTKGAFGVDQSPEL